MAKVWLLMPLSVASEVWLVSLEHCLRLCLLTSLQIEAVCFGIRKIRQILHYSDTNLNQVTSSSRVCNWKTSLLPFISQAVFVLIQHQSSEPTFEHSESAGRSMIFSAQRTWLGSSIIVCSAFIGRRALEGRMRRI